MEQKVETRLDNRLSNFGIRNLNVIEQNLWWAIVRLIKDKGCEILKFSREEIEAISGYNISNKSKNDFVTDMKNMGHKIVSINTELYDNSKNRWIIFSLFPVYEVGTDGIEIQVSKYFETWFNNIQKNFTRIDLSVLILLKSGYSKELYRFLMRWKNLRKDCKYPGFWSVEFGEFRRLMCIPEEYSKSDIERKILNPAKKELTSVNKDGWAPLEYLDINLLFEPNSKRKIKRIEFTFKQGSPPKQIKEFLEIQEPLRQEPLSKKTLYENNFKSGYIPGENSPAKGFINWLEDIDFFKDNEEYFEVRVQAKSALIGLYKELVIKNNSKVWTDVRFFAAANELIVNDKAMTSWNIEDAFSNIRTKRINTISSDIYDSLPEDKSKQLYEFVCEGKIK